jgi:hypothetical protein
MTGVTLAAREITANRDLDSAAVHGLLWALATPDMGLEHARVLMRAGRIEIAIFCMARTAADARASAIAICTLACRDSALLSGWNIDSVDTEDSR